MAGRKKRKLIFDIPEPNKDGSCYSRCRFKSNFLCEEGLSRDVKIHRRGRGAYGKKILVESFMCIPGKRCPWGKK